MFNIFTKQDFNCRLFRSFVVLSVLFIGACANTTHFTSDELGNIGSTTRVLLMPTDVLLSEQSAAGSLIPNAEWTSLAEGHMANSIRSILRKNNTPLVTNKIEIGTPGSDPRITQLVKLHGVVGASILNHQYLPVLKLPSKNDKFEWSLGPEARVLRERYNADYALFIYVRDSYASAGRVAVVVLAAAFGVGLQTGTQAGFASLIDLRTGNVVWFNRLLRGGGDLRTASAADDTVEVLLNNFPK